LSRLKDSGDVAHATKANRLWTKLKLIRGVSSRRVDAVESTGVLAGVGVRKDEHVGGW
jgi:hypothetical protein